MSSTKNSSKITITPICPYCDQSPYKTYCPSFIQHVNDCELAFQKGSKQKEEEHQRLQSEKLLLQDQFKELKQKLNERSLDYETSRLLSSFTEKFDQMNRLNSSIASNLNEQVTSMKKLINEKHKKTEQVIREESEQTKSVVKDEIKNLAGFLVELHEQQEKNQQVDKNLEEYAKKYLLGERSSFEAEEGTRKWLNFFRNLPPNELMKEGYIDLCIQGIMEQKIDNKITLRESIKMGNTSVVAFVKELRDIALVRSSQIKNKKPIMNGQQKLLH